LTKLIPKMGCYDLRKILRATPMHRRGSWRDGRIWNEGTPCKLPPDFANFQNFKHQIACIAMQYKAYQPHDSDFTTFRKCIFNVHQITTSGGKFNIFLARTRTKIPLRIHQNMPFQVNNSFFFWAGGRHLSRPSFNGEGTPSHTPRLHQASWIRPRIPNIPGRLRHCAHATDTPTGYEVGVSDGENGDEAAIERLSVRPVL